ncbi:helix-turn-helix domain-containing protein [Halorubrum sp. 48-1-W]|uniref:helix-turn-helix domain-containing protein n=1 Tax=Halorubrum sp. 48-1-W TaxID=2249761 RepID=UPI000DCE6493|nr:helix-turn-helix domain-containing protein [Halorubrum sp. 48-1-W]RAW45088.1 helix-turn-helix domain-containing protein [Halorubrum sp. 48-1-W]
MGAGIRAEVSLPTVSPSPFDGVVDGSIPIYSVARSRVTPASAVADGDEAPDGDTVVIEFLADADLDVPENVETVFDYGRKAAYRFEVPCVDESPFSVLDRHGVPATETAVRDGRLLVTFHATDLPTLRTVLEELQESCADMQVLRLLQSSTTPEESDPVTFDRSELTERQREVLSAAYDAGYFDHPKGANAGEVAADLGIDRSTFSEHIAAAQRKILATVLD